MACYVDEEEVWKCPKHPSKRRRTGICSTCLRDRLASLCPDCAKLRPCPCAAASTTSSSSSSSSSVANLLDGEPSLRRSRSVAIPFLRSKNTQLHTPNNTRAKATPSFLSILNRSHTKRTHPPNHNENISLNISNADSFDTHNKIEDFARMVTRSRSVSTASGIFRRADVTSSPATKSKFWHFPSPMKAFRSSKTPKVIVQDRSPLQRG